MYKNKIIHLLEISFLQQKIAAGKSAATFEDKFSDIYACELLLISFCVLQKAFHNALSCEPLGLHRLLRSVS